MPVSGADPEVKKVGHTYRMVVGAARVERSCLCAYSTRHIIGGSAGVLPEKNFEI